MGSLANKSPEELSSASPTQTGRTLLTLRQMLFRGEFRPGEKLSELPLVARLGVSRTPLRLALDRLAHEGLLEPFPSGGFVVRQFTVDDIWDAIEIRGVLEGTGARLAAERFIESRDLDPIRRYRDEMEALPAPAPGIDSFPQYLELNEGFHSAIIDVARSPMLRMTLDRVLALPFAGPSALVVPSQRSQQDPDLLLISLEHHRAIVEAIEHRQGTRAESLAREHSWVSRRSFEIALAHQSAWGSIPGASLIRIPARW
jgi:GntR family transcriptional regulator of vanillate catabolism